VAYQVRIAGVRDAAGNLVAETATEFSAVLTQGTGLIRGTVTDSSTGAPLPNATVRFADRRGNPVGFTTSDGVGRFISEELNEGLYFARTENAGGYVNETYNNRDCAGCSVITGHPIIVAAGAVADNIDFTLRGGAGRIVGTVTSSSTGQPLANVTVKIYQLPGVEIADGVTDPQGHYIVNGGLAAGTYFAKTSNTQGYFNKAHDDILCIGCSFDDTKPTPIVIADGQSAIVNFALAPGGARIQGFVNDFATGAPIANATVNIRRVDDFVIAQAVTDGNGQYVTDGGLPAGTYYAHSSNARGYLDEQHNGVPCAPCGSATDGAPIQVAAGNTTGNVNFRLKVGGSVGGRVVDQAT
jgi:hypothetical protein